MHAILTKTWDEAIPGALSAKQLSRELRENPAAFPDQLKAAANTTENTLVIRGLDALFQRHSDGYSYIKALINTLSDFDDDIHVRCGCNALVYAFLVGAKNFDFLIPEDRAGSSFRDGLPQWKTTLCELEALERNGDPLKDEWLRDAYLAVRPLMLRPSARDERRSLCALLIRGPSTLADIERDLGLSYDLSRRVVAPFVTAGIVTCREETQCYLIAEQAIPLALFLVRETLGIDPLQILGD